MLVKIFCFLILLQFIRSSDSLCISDCVEYLPPSRSIEVIEFDGYTFGFVEVNNGTNFTNCTYESNTGINGTFILNKTPIEDKKYNRKSNEISNLGQAGFCRLSIKNVDDKTPTKWSLRAYDLWTEKEYEADFNVKFFYKATPMNEVVSVLENGSFYQYINMDIKFVSCTLTINTTKVDLNLNNVIETELDGISIKSLGQGLCGFKATNSLQIKEPKWIFDAIDIDQKPYKALFTYQFFRLPPASERYTTIMTTLGLSESIVCGDYHNQDYCYLYDPTEKFIPTSQSDCHYSIPTTTLEDLGVWKCYIGKFPAVNSILYTVELYVNETHESILSWTNEDEQYVNIGCKISSKSSIKSCIMISPNSTVLNLQSGLAYDRYLAMGTDLSKSTCSLKIEKPLMEYEKGQWKCELRDASSRSGAFIYLDNTTVPNYEKYQKIVSQFGESFFIQCTVPYSSDYCYIKSPRGEVFEIKNNAEALLGICSLTVNNASIDHVGQWKCVYARETGVPDEEIITEVNLGEAMLYTKSVDASSGKNANLQCSTYGFPIKYCRFIAPDSLSYFIKNTESSNRISYYGKGLEYGECGITIKEAKPSDTGKWTCITEFAGKSAPKLSVVIDLYVDPKLSENPKLAIGLGTAAAVIVLSVGFGYFGVKKWKKRRAYASNSNRDNHDNSIDNSSQGDIFSYGSSVNYSTMTNENDDHLHQT